MEDVLPCPTCGRALRVDLEKPRERAPFFPFCSEGCRALDLGRFLDEEYRVSEPRGETAPGGDGEAGDGNGQG